MQRIPFDSRFLSGRYAHVVVNGNHRSELAEHDDFNVLADHVINWLWENPTTWDSVHTIIDHQGESNHVSLVVNYRGPMHVSCRSIVVTIGKLECIHSRDSDYVHVRKIA